MGKNDPLHYYASTLVLRDRVWNFRHFSISVMYVRKNFSYLYPPPPRYTAHGLIGLEVKTFLKEIMNLSCVRMMQLRYH